MIRTSGSVIDFPRAPVVAGRRARVKRAAAARRLTAVGFVLALFGTLQLGGSQAAKPLDIHFVDVEGGQATLLVAPTGESMLIDAGYPEYGGRDADRIAAAAKRAGISRLDYLVVTHYHRDHVGGVPAIVAKLPVRTFVDHGATVERGDGPEALFNAYVETRRTGRHLQVKAGDTIPIKGLDVRVVAAAGEPIRRALPDAGSDNPLCAGASRRDDDPGENAQSVGLMIGFGRFRMLNLGDLTWNKERDLVCPQNLLGIVDVYLTTHHGLPSSGSPVLVHATRPKVAVMNNGSTKGGSPDAWRIVRDSPGLEGLWQLHYAIKAGPDHNVPEQFIANLDESTAHPIIISAYPDGSFVVTNTRNGHSRRYSARS